MGWDIAGWLGIGGNDNKSSSKSKIKELRAERNEYRDQLKQQRKEAERRQKAYDAQQATLAQSVADLQIQQQQSSQYAQQLIAQQQANFAAEAQQRQDNFNKQLAQQEEAAAQAAAQAAAALAQARADAAEQRRIATNLGNAYVPDAIAGATSPSTTEGSLDGQRKRKDNELSELSIVTDASVNPMAKSGLQIA